MAQSFKFKTRSYPMPGSDIDLSDQRGRLLRRPASSYTLKKGLGKRSEGRGKRSEGSVQSFCWRKGGA